MIPSTNRPYAHDNVEVRTEGSVVSVVVGGTEQSRIDLDRPGQLEFEYMQHMDAVLRTSMAEPRPVRAAHIGGCGCALPLAWNERRPGSRQLAIEIDPWIAEQARGWSPLPRKPALRIRVGDGRAILESSHGTFDVIVRDAFANAAVPSHLQTQQWAEIVQSHLGEAGLYLANCAHGAGSNCRGDVAAAKSVFASTVIIGASKVLKGARWGNIVIAGWDSPSLLDKDELDRQLRRLPLPVSILSGRKLDLWLGGTRPLVDPPV